MPTTASAVEEPRDSSRAEPVGRWPRVNARDRVPARPAALHNRRSGWRGSGLGHRLSRLGSRWCLVDGTLLIGRRRELAALDEALAAAAAGQLQVVLVEGEAGGGKS